MPNASQKRTKRAALIALLMSRQPASTSGWLATMPTGAPSIRANPITMFFAPSGCSSKNSPSSTALTISSFMSYGLFVLSGTSVSSDISRRSAGSLVRRIGGASRLLSGR